MTNAADNEELDARGGPCQTPLADLLRSIPPKHRVVIEATEWPPSSHFIPVGRLMHEAANELDALRARVAELEHKQEKWHEVIDANERALTSLAAQLQQVKADAERLDWVDAQWVHNLHIEVRAKSTRPECYEPEATVFTRSDDHRAATVRAAIDAARRNDGTA